VLTSFGLMHVGESKPRSKARFGLVKKTGCWDFCVTPCPYLVMSYRYPRKCISSYSFGLVE
jgi:hypothetical protein